MNHWMRCFMAAGVAAAIVLASPAGFTQTVVGPLGPGVGTYDPYRGYGRVWWQYRGGPKSTSTTDLYYAPPYDLGPYQRFYREEIVGPR